MRWFRFAVGSLLVAGTLAAGTLVVPGVSASVEGGENNGFPFNLPLFSQPSMRYQQVYGAPEFSPLGAILITGLRFRRDGTGPFNDPFVNVSLPLDIRLSTTTRGVDALNSTFAANTGADETQVHAGTVTISATGSGTPNPFDIVIDFTTPFFYNPALGNLLLDIRAFGAVATTQFDAVYASGGTSRLFSLSSVDDATGWADSLGLVTEFAYATPEPATGLLTLAAALGLFHAKARTRSHTSSKK